MEFADLVRSQRLKVSKSARAFYNSANLTCTYYYYGSVERGHAVPSVAIALEIISALGLDKRKGLMAWARSQMQDEETKAFFTDIDGNSGESVDQLPNARSIVINRSQATYLKQNPIAMEILVFINCYGRGPIYIDGIKCTFGLPMKEIETYVDALFQFGLIDRNTDGELLSKEWVVVPYDREYESLKDATFSRAYDQFQKQEPDSKIRNVVTFLATKDQQQEIQSKIRSLIDWFISIENRSPESNAVPYTFGVFGSPRIFGIGEKKQ
jgi:hypothetical protein